MQGAGNGGPRPCIGTTHGAARHALIDPTAAPSIPPALPSRSVRTAHRLPPRHTLSLPTPRREARRQAIAAIVPLRAVRAPG